MSYLLNISKEKLQELKIIAAREGKTIREILEAQIDQYLKVHGEGNPQFTMTDFVNNPKFMAFPATGSNLEHKKAWFEAHKDDKKTLEELAYDIDEYQGLLKKYSLR